MSCFHEKITTVRRFSLDDISFSQDKKSFSRDILSILREKKSF